MENVLKIHWNFEENKYNLITIGTEVKEGMQIAYYIPEEAHFINPKESRLVRVAYKLHLFINKFKNIFR